MAVKYFEVMNYLFLGGILILKFEIFATNALRRGNLKSSKYYKQYYEPVCNCSRYERPTMSLVCGGSNYTPFMDTLEQYLQQQCNLVDPTRCIPNNYIEEVDFIVVGAGASGSVVASRLSEISTNEVLLLEAGGPAPTGAQVPGMYFQYVQYPEIDWNFALEPQKQACLSKNGICHYPRGIKVIEDLPGVGQNLRNHASVGLSFNVLNDDHVSPINNQTIREFITERQGPLTSTGLSQLTGFVYSKYANPKTDAPDIQIFFGGYLAGCSKSGSDVIEGSRKVTISPTLLRPKSVGYIQLRDRYPESPPIINPNILQNPDDVKIIIEGIRIVEDIVANTNLSTTLNLDASLYKDICTQVFDSDQYWECVIRWATNPENHQVGTCKMGQEGDGMAVTDELLKVRGIHNLRVIDSSVLPNVPSGNLVAPAIMVGEKGADLIIDEWLYKMY